MVKSTQIARIDGGYSLFWSAWHAVADCWDRLDAGGVSGRRTGELHSLQLESPVANVLHDIGGSGTFGDQVSGQDDIPSIESQFSTTSQYRVRPVQSAVSLLDRGPRMGLTIHIVISSRMTSASSVYVTAHTRASLHSPISPISHPSLQLPTPPPSTALPICDRMPSWNSTPSFNAPRSSIRTAVHRRTSIG